MSKTTISPNQTRPTNVEEVPKAEVAKALATPLPYEIKVNANFKSSAVPSLQAIKPFSPLLEVMMHGAVIGE